MSKHIREIDSLGNEIPDGESGRDHLIPYVHMQETRVTTSGNLNKSKEKNGNHNTSTRTKKPQHIKRNSTSKSS